MFFVSAKARSVKSSLCPLRTLMLNPISDALSNEVKQSEMVLGGVTKGSSGMRGH